jgi:probable HAF family extracellular repeat protein
MREVTGSDNTEASAINAAGRIAGNINDVLFYTGHGVFITGPNGNRSVELAGLAGRGNAATDINASGQVVGVGYIDSSVYQHAYITSSNYTFVSDLGSLGGTTSSATAVNDSGQVVGFSQISSFGPSHAFITDLNSNMTDLGTLGGDASSAFDINSTGQVVGESKTGIGNAFHAFITGPNGTGMIDLNSLVHLPDGVFLKDARGINDMGQIIANASDGHAYFLSPIPEPETYAMLLAGLSVMSCIARRRKIHGALS